jgi:transposase
MYIFEKTVKTTTGSYTYVCLGHNKRVNGKTKRAWEVTLCRKDKIEESLPLIKQRLSGKKPVPREYQFGLPFALLAICEEIGLSDIVNQCVDKREQTIPAGDYLTMLAINRACHINSKNQVQHWFNKTTLVKRFPALGEALTSQNIWNQMAYFDQETIRAIEARICQVLVSRFKIGTDCFLFDPTNFFTYIREHEKNTIAQRGHNKKKRNDLRQINTSLMVTREDCNVPVMHETYEGNIPDVSHFKSVIKHIEERFKGLGLSLPKVTLVFDKGNNSDDAYQLLDEAGFRFVSSVRPSMTKVQTLMEVPLASYDVLWTKENGHQVLGYRAPTDLYTGKKNTLIATFDEDTCELQEFSFDKAVTKKTDELADFVATKLNTKPQWKDKEAVVAKIERDFLSTNELKSLVQYSIKETSVGLQLTWHVDDDARTEALKDAGKSFIFTNQNKWSTVDIVKTYRSQRGVEDQFKEFNDRDRIRVMPMYHYTNQKIRAHVFISVLALLITNLLYRKLERHGIDASKDVCINELEDIKEIHLDHGDGIPASVTITQMTELQRRMAHVLNLNRYYRS